MSRLGNSDIITLEAAEAITALQAVVINADGKAISRRTGPAGNGLTASLSAPPLPATSSRSLSSAALRLSPATTLTAGTTLW